jgi:DNA polymerase III sliding clamp (beta) subunit (PCNA family)
MERKEILEAVTPLSPAVTRLTGGHIRIANGQSFAVGDGLAIMSRITEDFPECLPDYATLRAALSGMTGDTLFASMSNGRLLLSSRGRRTVNCAPPEMWPHLPPVGGEAVSVDGDRLSAAMTFVAKAASSDMARANLCGVHFNGTDVVATDGYSMRIAEVNDILPRFTLPSSSVAALMKNARGDCEMRLDERRASVSYDGGSVASVLIGVPFPEQYRRLVPGDNGTNISAPADELLRAVNAVAAFTTGGDKSMKVSVSPQSVTLSCDSADEPIDAVVDGPAKEFWVSATRVADMLAAYGKCDVTVTINTALRFSDSAGRIGVLLPLKG